MRHRKKSEKFSRNYSQRRALVKSLVRAVIKEERVITTESKAKALRSWVDNCIELAKKGGLHHKRLAYKLLCDHELVKRLFDSIGPRFKEINGGYTRVVDIGWRKGDGAKLSLLELTKQVEKDKIKKTKTKESPDKPSTEQPSEPAEPKKALKGIKKLFNKRKSK